ncbi:MAG: alpha-hydroxy-acid oxidizing protein, partial [Solirubrobacterales bacterium]|nr:alpha-hydroxy-acid oxidizing protein [Solirubrobacterales bacterium]
DIAWLCELWGGPFMLKGVMRVDDAKRAVDAGVSAISVSNHGGNNLDGTPASARSRSPTTAATTWTAPPPPSARYPPSPRRSAISSRCCWTVESGAAATWSRRWRSARRP